ncbi:UDP-3-O-[3-hydroxymyristoyl] N-acetylglucosamine deacetylase [Candidatus Saganbacteria bacterium]|uniref:UDP-3-O-acyl-N-acetylglucosamine deacetylase n=1 Tax=Candidatus Saganbacteria bacterium TaxID=2575572 RepID=A0A9D6UN08_UNCSA|nr:UDP-3-O-[3-hydroxymyristoyl] N-acetylglucosamine deacetylase [Candidatus Saganbacteria bacterium]
MSQSPGPNHVEIEGIGLHSGEKSKIILRPALPGAGIVFIQNGEKIPALLQNLKGTQRTTSLCGLSVVEHLLSALAGTGVDDLEIEVIGREIPILDGSALPYVEALQKGGFLNPTIVGKATIVAKPKKERNYLEIKTHLKVTGNHAALEVFPYRGFKVNFTVEFPGVGVQQFLFDAEKQDYKKEIAPARTFGWREELEELKTKGLALGVSLDNALVLDKNGYVNQPRFPDEIVRHKILDLIGDLSLLGRPLRAEIRAARSGHKLNADLVEKIQDFVSRFC